jgi:SDR family mycofactocin-dependent oxidoreductase
MTGRVEGKVAFITGAARGQGRSHAVRLAEEGADIIAIDICSQIESNSYPLATTDDLAETARRVKQVGRRIVALQADVRYRDQLSEAVEAGVQQLGKLDILVANAGILPTGDKEWRAFIDAVDVDMVGVINAVAVSLPHLGSGASIIVTGSTAGLTPGKANNPALGPGGAGYSWAKQAVTTFTRVLAGQLGPRNIRVNAVHPTSCDTHLIHHQDVWSLFRPDLEQPTEEDALGGYYGMNLLPTPWVEPIDISNMVLFLASDEARFVTGTQMRVDAGGMLLSDVDLGIG